MHLSQTPVSLTRLSSYDVQPLAQSVDLHLSSCGVSHGLSSARVLLKPNLITARFGSLACTEGALLMAVARWFVDQGARVAVGDSPAFGSAAHALGRIGVSTELQRLGVQVVEFNTSRQVELPSGRKAGVAAAALDCDLLVNLPRVKAHQQVLVTLAVKNLFGCLVGLRKPWWHMVHGGKGGSFARMLVELLTVLPRSVTLADGVRAMHGTGPIHGEPFALGLVAGGQNPISVDTALLHVLGIEPSRSPLWLAAHQARLPGTVIEGIGFSHLMPDELQIDGFRIPSELSPVRFDPLHFLKNTVKRLAIGLQ